MIAETDILLLHEFAIRDFGGSRELRDRDSLLSAITRPFQTFEGEELYKTPFEKAAALGESLIINHPFVDGNKRTSFLAMIALLHEYQIEINTASEEAYKFVVAMAMGEKTYADIVAWLRSKN